MTRFLVALGLTLFLAGCATTPHQTVTTLRTPKTQDRVRVEAVLVEVVKNDATSRILAQLRPSYDGTVSSFVTGTLIQSSKFRTAIQALRHCPDTEVKDFPTLIVADGERREADSQKPMRYVSEYHDPKPESESWWPTPKTWVTRGVGMKWSCEATMESDDSAALVIDLDDTIFDRWAEYRSVRVKDGKEAVHVIQQPVFSKRSFSTRLTMGNGMTVVLGGMIREDKVNREGHQETRKINRIIFISIEIVDANGRPKTKLG